MNTISEIQISYKPKIKKKDRLKITKSKNVYKLVKKLWSNDIEYIEEAMILCLNIATEVLGFVKISSGGTTGTVIDIKIIFQIALKINAHGIILIHNHPSGSVKPSVEDSILVEKLVKAGKIMDIPLLDNIIISKDEYYSYADENNL